MARYYKNGYKAKLDYYLEHYWNALDAEDANLMDKFLRKLSYFHFKHQGFIREQKLNKLTKSI
jgi:hypothetical protein